MQLPILYKKYARASYPVPYVKMLCQKVYPACLASIITSYMFGDSCCEHTIHVKGTQGAFYAEDVMHLVHVNPQIYYSIKHGDIIKMQITSSTAHLFEVVYTIKKIFVYRPIGRYAQFKSKAPAGYHASRNCVTVNHGECMFLIT
jgi:hypothetical protein